MVYYNTLFDCAKGFSDFDEEKPFAHFIEEGYLTGIHVSYEQLNSNAIQSEHYSSSQCNNGTALQ